MSITDNPITIEILSGETVTVPSDATWVGTITLSSGTSGNPELEINGVGTFRYTDDDSPHQYRKLVFEGGTVIEEISGGTTANAFFTGFEL